MIVSQYFTTVTSLKTAITEARKEAKAEAIRDCGPGGIVQSRGAFIRVINANGDIIKGECDSWEFKGTAAELEELNNLLRYETKVARITIEGGFNWAANLRDHADGSYDAWVSEWFVIFGEREEIRTPAPVAPAAQAEPVEVEAVEVEAVAAARASVLATFSKSLEATEAALRDLPDAPVLGWVVACHDIYLKFEVAGFVARNPSNAPVWKATRFTEHDAKVIAGTVTNGAADKGEAIELRVALERELVNLREMTELVERSAK